MMKNLKNEISSLFIVIARTLEDLSEKQYDKILSGKGKLVYQEEDIQKNEIINMRIPKRRVIEDSEILSISTQLCNLNTREEAYDLLKSNKMNIGKSDLVKLSSLLKVYVSKNDTRDKIIDKIVESVVGAKLRSEAIKNTDLKGGSSQISK